MSIDLPSAFQICGMCTLFLLGLAFLQFTWSRKSFSIFSSNGRGVSRPLKLLSIQKKPKKRSVVAKFRSATLSFLMSLRLINEKCANDGVDNVCNPVEVPGSSSKLLEESVARHGEEIGIEDEISDVVLLRKLVKSERRRAEVACAELKKERMAAASASEEAMAMILKLQSQKSATDIEANQYRRFAEHKQELDREVIESLQWIIVKHEHIMDDLEARWRYCRQKLKNIVEKEVLEELDNGILSSPEFFTADYHDQQVSETSDARCADSQVELLFS